jgi:aspartyl-tRNA(Asn)/glutamyl-tRNA(Gln) amidotransferase subunit B
LSERLDVAEFLEGVVAAGADSGISANWVRTDIMRILKETGLKADELPFTPEALGDLLVKISKGVLSNTAAKDVLEQMYRKGLDVAAAMNAAGVDPGGISEGTLEGVIRKVLEANPVEAGLILSGEDPSGKKKKFLQGLVMREIRGQSPVQDVASMMDKVMGEMKKPNGSSV